MAAIDYNNAVNGEAYLHMSSYVCSTCWRWTNTSNLQVYLDCERDIVTHHYQTQSTPPKIATQLFRCPPPWIYAPLAVTGRVQRVTSRVYLTPGAPLPGSYVCALLGRETTRRARRAVRSLPLGLPEACITPGAHFRTSRPSACARIVQRGLGSARSRRRPLLPRVPDLECQHRDRLPPLISQASLK